MATSLSSLLIHFGTTVCAFCLTPHSLSVCSKVWPKLLIIWWLGRAISSSHTGSASHRCLLNKQEGWTGVESLAESR